MTRFPEPDHDAVEMLLAFADLVEKHYVLADRATGYAKSIRSHAVQLAAHLPCLDLVPDRHLGLRLARHDDFAPSPGGTHTPPGGGFRRIGDLDDSVCLVEIQPVFSRPEDALPELRAVAQSAALARALVLDLRRCGGGDTDTAALVHGWLLGPSPVRIGRFEHRGSPSVDCISDPGVGVYFTGPVRILTSSRTFSGGEDIAYVQHSLGRARVFGEQTHGGAHPVEHFPLPGGRTCQIPVARCVIDVTGSNWEGVGVTPDVICPADAALNRARHELAALRPY
jgi:hypothetical protein